MFKWKCYSAIVTKCLSDSVIVIKCLSEIVYTRRGHKEQEEHGFKKKKIVFYIN